MGGGSVTVGEGAEDGRAAGAVVLVDVLDGSGGGAAASSGAGAAVGGVHRGGRAAPLVISGETTGPGEVIAMRAREAGRRVRKEYTGGDAERGGEMCKKILLPFATWSL